MMNSMDLTLKKPYINGVTAMSNVTCHCCGYIVGDCKLASGANAETLIMNG